MSANQQFDLLSQADMSLQQASEFLLLNSIVNNPEHFKFNEQWTKTKTEEIIFARVMSEFKLEHREALDVIANGFKNDDVRKKKLKEIRIQSAIKAEEMAIKKTVDKARTLAKTWMETE